MKSDKTFNIELFFLYMRSEEKRLETFNMTSYPFPYPEMSNLLAKIGFIYTLYNSSIQCAFCRIVLGNISTKTNAIMLTHTLLSDCRFARFEEVGNEELVDKFVTKPTENTIIQCKICLVKEINVVYGCGHLIACSDCSDQTNHCSVCRAPLIGKRKIYLS